MPIGFKLDASNTANFKNSGTDSGNSSDGDLPKTPVKKGNDTTVPSDSDSDAPKKPLDRVPYTPSKEANVLYHVELSKDFYDNQWLTSEQIMKYKSKLLMMAKFNNPDADELKRIQNLHVVLDTLHNLNSLYIERNQTRNNTTLADYRFRLEYLHMIRFQRYSVAWREYENSVLAAGGTRPTYIPNPDLSKKEIKPDWNQIVHIRNIFFTREGYPYFRRTTHLDTGGRTGSVSSASSINSDSSNVSISSSDEGSKIASGDETTKSISSRKSVSSAASYTSDSSEDFPLDNPAIVETSEGEHKKPLDKGKGKALDTDSDTDAPKKHLDKGKGRAIERESISDILNRISLKGKQGPVDSDTDEFPPYNPADYDHSNGEGSSSKRRK